MGIGNVEIGESWYSVLSEELKKPYFKDLIAFVKEDRKTHTIFPTENLIFSAFQRTPLDKLKVVIIGQDPYHGESQANGLCFSVLDDVKYPPSLRNIFKELKADVGIEKPTSGNLESWAGQGILMLNTTLTVRKSKPGSHQKKGWEEFTDSVMKIISDQKKDVIFLLWGNFAQSTTNLIDIEKHHFLKSSHPSPFSAHRGFLGCKHFSKTNKILESIDRNPIDWRIS